MASDRGFSRPDRTTLWGRCRLKIFSAKRRVLFSWWEVRGSLSIGQAVRSFRSHNYLKFCKLGKVLPRSQPFLPVHIYFCFNILLCTTTCVVRCRPLSLPCMRVRGVGCWREGHAHKTIWKTHWIMRAIWHNKLSSFGSNSHNEVMHRERGSGPKGD